MATLMPWSAANLPCVFQYGVTASSHCQFSTSRYSGGQEQVTQLGNFAWTESPGQPEKSTTVITPSFSARRMVLRLVSAYLAAISLSGCSGLPWLDKAEIVMPASAILLLKVASSAGLSSIDSLAWASPG